MSKPNQNPRVRFFAENMDRLSRRDRVFINNPVIMQGLGIAPIVLPAYNLENALILSLAVCLLLTPTRMIATFIGQRVGFIARAIIYVFTAGVVYIGVSYLVEYLFGSAITNVGIYLLLLVVEPLILKRYESPKSERLFTSFKKGIITTLGYCLVLLLVAAIRELLAFGTLGGSVAYTGALFPMAAMPAGGFVILGLIAAIWRGVVSAFKNRINAGVSDTE